MTQQPDFCGANHGCAIHADVLMIHHAHLLVTPSAAGAVSRMMQSLGRVYVGRINSKYARIGTLWEGRDKAWLVDAHDYLLLPRHRTEPGTCGHASN